MKKQNNKEPWQIVAARFFVENSEKGFSEAEYKEYVLKTYQIPERHLHQFFIETIQLPAGRDYTTMKRDGVDGWIPPMELVSVVTDYDELKEARKNSKNAFVLSLMAIILSVVSICIGVAQLFMVQDVIVKNESINAKISNLPILQAK
jgi:hypothetical protein